MPSAMASEAVDNTTDTASVKVELDGKPVDPQVADALNSWAGEQDLNLDAEFEETPVTNAGQISARNRGGIDVPAGYVYDPSKGSLHDYCTKSPDQFPAPGENADFSGACARHDMCYGRANTAKQYVDCNAQLAANMVAVCKSVYTSNLDPRKSGCIGMAPTYWTAITLKHPSQWPGFL